jgi:hypothetical protein
MLHFGKKLDFAEEPVGGDADDQFRVENLEGNSTPLFRDGVKDARGTAPPNLPIDLVAIGKGFAGVVQQVSADGTLVSEWRGPQWQA